MIIGTHRPRRLRPTQSHCHRDHAPKAQPSTRVSRQELSKKGTIFFLVSVLRAHDALIVQGEIGKISDSGFIDALPNGSRLF